MRNEIVFPAIERENPRLEALITSTVLSAAPGLKSRLQVPIVATAEIARLATVVILSALKSLASQTNAF